jgi:hypothetical protein
MTNVSGAAIAPLREDIHNNDSSRSGVAAAVSPSIVFESLTFSDGTTVTLNPDDVVVFVGPNNAGKSAALRDLQERLGPPVPGTIIKVAAVRRTGSIDEIYALLERIGRGRGDGQNRRYDGFGFSFDARTAAHYWQNDARGLRGIFCVLIGTETRITASNPVNGISILDQAPSHPIHLLYMDDRVEQRISRYFRRAFGKDLIVFHGGGASWPLLVGERPVATAGEDRVSATYIERLLASTVPLQAQGDGMRSFATVILHMLAPMTASILLLDEPEAYLHPPQARLLGEFIAKERPPQAQLFVATHSADVLVGLLNAASAHLRVLRIQRDGSINRVKELDKALARTISADPLMKFSSVLSGVFHERVIVCESDADCMFYSALLDLPQIHGERQPDVLFVQAGGKHRMATLAEALLALGVIVDVIADFDVLNDESVLERLVRTLGGDWAAVQAEARPLKAAIEQHKPWLTAAEVSKGIRDTLDRAPTTGEFPKNLRNEIDAIFRKASPWDAIKSAGEAAVPAGQPTQHYQRLQVLCKSFGLWIVPVGELEGFCKSEGGHGPRWVQKVVADHNLTTDSELGRARAFVAEIWSRVTP